MGKLAPFQLEKVNKLYDSFVCNGVQQLVFKGPQGSGKTTIVMELTKQLKEDWHIIYIGESSPTLPPYTAWYENLKLINNSKNKISWGISFDLSPFIPISIEAQLGKKSHDFYFNEVEKAIITGIVRKSGSNNNVLLVADNYSSWDEASLALFQKITLIADDIFPGKRFHILAIESDVNSGNPIFQSPHSILLYEEVEATDITQILRNKGISSFDNIAEIASFAGYNLDLIVMIAAYYDENRAYMDHPYSIDELIEKRILSFSKELKSVCTKIEPASILNNGIQVSELAYLSETDNYKCEEILQKATKANLLKRGKDYSFIHEKIKHYFQNRLSFKKKYLHNQFYSYLSIEHPEDYMSRAYHLIKSENCERSDASTKAIYLLAIERERRTYIFQAGKSQECETLITSAMGLISDSLLHRLISRNIELYNQGYRTMMQSRYAEAIEFFRQIDIPMVSFLFEIEVSRLILLSYVQLADSLPDIKQEADLLYELIEKHPNESDQWCQSALVLMEVYSDRYINLDRIQSLKSQFLKVVRKHMDAPHFLSLYYMFRTRASIYSPAIFAREQILPSIDYYKERNNERQLYYAYCNYGANCMLMGEYDKARQSFLSCESLIETNPRLQSQYKIYNNLVVLSYLQLESKVVKTDRLDVNTDMQRILSKKALECADRMIEIQELKGEERSLVSDFNQFTFFCMAENFEKAEQILTELKNKRGQMEPFYMYYLFNAEIAICILQKDYKQAQFLTCKLDEVIIKAPLLFHYVKIFEKRHQKIDEMIKEKFSGNAIEYNYQLLRSVGKTQDSSWWFYGRGLLFSDLQFLSL